MIVLGRYNYLTWKCIAMQQWIARLDTSLSSAEQTRDALARGQGTFMRCKDLNAIGAGADQHDRGGAGRQGAGRQADRLGKPQDRHGLPDALIQKIVVFEFVNNYFSLLYIAFFVHIPISNNWFFKAGSDFLPVPPHHHTHTHNMDYSPTRWP